MPWEKVKDPSCLARELRWRVNVAKGDISDDEEEPVAAVVNGAGKKGKGKEKEKEKAKVVNGHAQEREMDVDDAGASSSKRRRLESASAESTHSHDPKYVPKRCAPVSTDDETA